MNRVLSFLTQRCPGCAKLREVERKIDAARGAATLIEAEAGGLIEFWIPSADRVLHPKPDDDEVGIRMLVAIEPRLATIDESLRRYAIDELRGLATELDGAADRLEGGAE